METLDLNLESHLLRNMSISQYEHFFRELVTGFYPLKLDTSKLLDSQKLKVETHLSAGLDLVKKSLEHSDIKCGDFVLINGELKRVAYIHSIKKVQLCDDGSFCMGKSGLCSHSGGLESPVDLSNFKHYNKTKNGSFWSFVDGMGANKGVYFSGSFKVWE